MGGRLYDWLGAGDTPDKPDAALDMPGLLGSPGSTAFFFDTTLKILSIYDESGGGSWFDVDVTALASLTFATLPDVDFSTPPTDGQVFYWDTGSSKLVPGDLPTPLFANLEAFQDAVGAMGVNGTGTSFVYDDAAGQFRFDSTITQYTDEMAQDAVAAAFAAGTHTGITVSYTDGSNKIELAIDIEYIQDLVGLLLADGGAIDVIYDDAGNSLGINIIEASSSEMWAAAASNRVVTPKKLKDASTPVTIAYAASITPDLATGLNFDIGTLTGPITINNFTNTYAGASGVLHFVQDGAGGRVATWGSNFRAAGGLAVGGLLSTAINAIDEISYFVRTDGKIVLSTLKDVKA